MLIFSIATAIGMVFISGPGFAKKIDLQALLSKLEVHDPETEKRVCSMGETLRVWDANHQYVYLTTPYDPSEPTEERTFLLELSEILKRRALKGDIQAIKVIYRAELLDAVDVLMQDSKSSESLAKIVATQIINGDGQGGRSLQHIRSAVIDYFTDTSVSLPEPEPERRFLKSISDLLYASIGGGGGRLIGTMIDSGFISDLGYIIWKGEKHILADVYGWLREHPNNHYGRVEVLKQLRSPYLADTWALLDPSEGQKWCDLMLDLTHGKDESVGDYAMNVLSFFVHSDRRVLPRLREVFNRGLEVSRDDYKELTISQMFAAEAIAQAALPIHRTVSIKGRDLGAGPTIHEIEVEEGIRVAGSQPNPLNFFERTGNITFEWYVRPSGESAQFHFEWPWKWEFSHDIFVSYGQENSRSFTTVFREYPNLNRGLDPHGPERTSGLYIPTTIFGWRDGIIFNLIELFDENRGQGPGDSLISIWAAKILALIGDPHGLKFLDEITPASSGRTKFNKAFLTALRQFVGSEPYQSALDSDSLRINERTDGFSRGIEICKQTLERLNDRH